MFILPGVNPVHSVRLVLKTFPVLRKIIEQVSALYMKNWVPAKIPKSSNEPVQPSFRVPVSVGSGSGPGIM